MQTTQSYLAGIDTGGTYTDAVLVDPKTLKVVASAKALTTRGDLSIGIVEALERVIAAEGHKDVAQSIKLLSISTTLATNAVVEGHGSSVAVLLIGFDPEMVRKSKLAETFPNLPIEIITGGHDHNGDEIAALDTHAIEAVVDRHKDTIAAFAVASRFAVRNAAHELKAREIIFARAQKPVTLSTELSSDLDAPRRALTAVLNARLLSRIADLIQSVNVAKERLGINAPLMITRGDGSLARADAVVRRPIETILSGPAASLIGASKLTRLPDFILSDIGGTTTDLAILRNGRPTITAQGADLGGWRTMVNAIDVKTLGLGGDSAVALTMGGRITVGPERAVPVSLIASRFPGVLKDLEAELDETEGVSHHGRFVMLPLGATTKPNLALLSDRERQLLERIEATPRPMSRLAAPMAAARTIAAMARKGLIQVACFTPSDAAHVLGLQANWSKEGAVLAARLLYRAKTMKNPDLAGAEQISREVWSETVRLSGLAVLASALGVPHGRADAFLEAIADGRGAIGLARVSAVPAVPIVAVGGPAPVYYPEVGKRIGCEIVYPDHYDVANAVGAATGAVVGRSTVEVNGDGSGVFQVYAGGTARRFVNAAEAMAFAESTAVAAATAQAESMGARDVEVEVSRDVFRLPDAVDDNGISHARLHAEAIGQASFAR
ncbi:MAG: hydantoinase/oxoprolinase family protein [Hyphomicrobiales bacterium]